MNELANILSKKYNMSKRAYSFEENYPEKEFVIAGTDKCSCSIYFTDEHFSQLLEIIQYIRSIAHTISTFESKEWIGEDFEEYEEIGDLEENEWDEIYEMEEVTPLRQREEKLSELEQELAKILEEEKQIEELYQRDGEEIDEEK